MALSRRLGLAGIADVCVWLMVDLVTLARGAIAVLCGRLPLSRLEVREADAQLFRKVGLMGPYTQPVDGEVVAGGAAAQAGLQPGDLVRRVGAV